jgi:putative membrane protein
MAEPEDIKKGEKNIQDGKPSSGNTTDHSTQYLANERTFLAWIRTSVAIIGLGFVVARFSLFLREFALVVGKGQVNASSSPPPSVQNFSAFSASYSPSSILGLIMVALGVVLIAYAFFNYRNAQRIIENGGAYTSKNSIMYLASTALIIFGIVVIIYLISIAI